MLYDLGRVQIQKRNRLPHWHTQHGIYFVTFNLFDALPQHVRTKIREEADAQLQHIRNLHGECTIVEKRAIEEWIHVKLGEALDETYGSCFMRDQRIASIVANAIIYFDEQRYSLFAWSVMPNHVHVVMTLAKGERIDKVVHSWKSYSAKQANKVLRRVGEFWQDDYWDRSIRDERELENTIAYVVSNPAKAGLRGWRFVRSYPERIPS